MNVFEQLEKAMSSGLANAARSEAGTSTTRDSPYWVLSPPYTFETAFLSGLELRQRGHAGPSEYRVRWITHPTLVNTGVKFCSTHQLVTGPNDQDPATYYCKEGYFPRNPDADPDDPGSPLFLSGFDNDGQEEEAEDCFFCQMSIFMAPHKEHLKSLGRENSRAFSGEELHSCVDSMGLNSKLLLPLIVQCTVESGAKGNNVLIPSARPEDQKGVLLFLNASRPTWGKFLHMGKSYQGGGGDITSEQTGGWMTLGRVPMGKGNSTSLSHGESTPLDKYGQRVMGDFPSIQGWGKKPPSEQSTRKTLNLSYRDAEYRFRKTTWFGNLSTAVPEIADDWEWE